MIHETEKMVHTHDKFCDMHTESEMWLADTGATSHITTCNKFMTYVQEVNVKVIVGDGKEVTCNKHGDIHLYNDDNK